MKHLTIKLKTDVSDMLERFQGHYQAEYGKRISKEEVINIALEVYIKKCYELSGQKDQE